MLLTKVPFAKKVWALPFLTVLCPSERYDEGRGIRHRKLDEARPSSDFVDQQVIAPIGFGICW